MANESSKRGEVAPPAGPEKRWTMGRKRAAVIRLLRGESVDAVSRELGVEIYKLETWRERALAAMEEGLRERGGDPLEAELDVAKKRIGELSMENELLRERCRRDRPFGLRRSKR